MIDVSELLTDPDFSSTATLIKRASTVNEFGEQVIVETPITIIAVVQSAGKETLTRIPAGARLSDIIDVYYKGTLEVQSTGGYADVIVWRGRRYQVQDTEQRDYYTKAICSLEAVSA